MRMPVRSSSESERARPPIPMGSEKWSTTRRNRWSAQPGTSGRHGSESVVAMARVMQRGRGHLLATSQMIFEVIDDYRDEFPVSRVGRMLGVSRSGYYARRGRPRSQREMANRELDKKIDAVYDRSHGTYRSVFFHS